MVYIRIESPYSTRMLFGTIIYVARPATYLFGTLTNVDSVGITVRGDADK
jgi:hypothetical protein